MHVDWKFTLSLAAAVGGIIIPIWLWQSDLKSNSISVRLASSVELQPPTHNSIGDLKLVIAGEEIQSPYLSTIELVNDGSRPIPAANFETPLELRVGENVKLIRATVSKSFPDDLQPRTSTEAQSVKLAPLLLNPNDSISFAILSSGAKPQFSVKSRIAGISKISFEDATAKKAPWRIYAFNLPIAFLGMLIYLVFSVELVRPGHFSLSRPVALAVMISSAAGSSSILRRSLESLGLDPEGNYRLIFSLAAAGVGSIVVFFLLSRRSRRGVA
jgi:hypothetical protein